MMQDMDYFSTFVQCTVMRYVSYELKYKFSSSVVSHFARWTPLFQLKV